MFWGGTFDEMSESALQPSVGELLEELIKSVHRNVQSTEAKEAENVRSFQEITSWAQPKGALPPPSDKFVKKCKIHAYEILLKKCRNARSQDGCADEGYCDENINPLFELKLSQFELSLMLGQTRYLPCVHSYETLKKSLHRKQKLLEESIDFVSSNANFKDEHGEGRAILTLLVLLKNSVPDAPSDQNFFALRKFPEIALPKIEANYFSIDWPENNIMSNPYISEQVRRITHFNVGAQRNENPSSQSLQRQPNLRPAKRASIAMQMTSNKWESLGRRYVLGVDSIPTEKKFASECGPAAMHLLAKKSLANRNNFEAKIISIQKFVEHIRALLVGIESESFTFDQRKNTFSMVDNLTVEHVLPVTMASYVQNFLECGACYKRLKMLVSKNLHNFKFKYEGFLFKVKFGHCERIASLLIGNCVGIFAGNV